MAKEERIFETCPRCGASVRDVNMPEHLMKAHGIEAEDAEEYGEGNDEEDEPEIAITNNTFISFLQMKLQEGSKNEEDARRITKQASDDWKKITRTLSTGIPTAGSMARFEQKHKDMLIKIFRNMGDSPIASHLEMIRSQFIKKSDLEMKKIADKMTLKDGLLELEKKNKGDALIQKQFELINMKKPGFEEYLIDQFFSEERCRKCPLIELKANECEAGRTICVYDEEFLRFEDDRTRIIVEKIIHGDDDPDELRIPEKYLEYQREVEKLRNGIKQKNKSD